jgi:hypothetical protein
MLEACYSCGLEAAPSDFERLNNAIVRAASRGGAFGKLNVGWQDEVVEERNWKMALPPLWASLLENYWKQYAELYRAAGDKTLANPYDVAPTGISGALRDLYRPTVQVAEQAKKQVEQQVAAAKKAVTDKAKNLLQTSGKLLAEGAAEETQKQATNWGAWAAGIAAIGFGGYLAMRGKRGGFAGTDNYDRIFTKCYEKNKLKMSNRSLSRHCDAMAAR